MAYYSSKRSKYGAKKTKVDGITFDSKAEAGRYCELKLLLKAGKISNLELQPRFLLQEKFKDNEGKTHRAIEYVADFMYLIVSTGEIVVEDVKGVKTDVYAIKKKLFLHRYKDYIFREISA